MGHRSVLALTRLAWPTSADLGAIVARKAEQQQVNEASDTSLAEAVVAEGAAHEEQGETDSEDGLDEDERDAEMQADIDPRFRAITDEEWVAIAERARSALPQAAQDAMDAAELAYSRQEQEDAHKVRSFADTLQVWKSVMPRYISPESGETTFDPATDMAVDAAIDAQLAEMRALLSDQRAANNPAAWRERVARIPLTPDYSEEEEER